MAHCEHHSTTGNSWVKPVSTAGNITTPRSARKALNDLQSWDKPVFTLNDLQSWDKPVFTLNDRQSWGKPVFTLNDRQLVGQTRIHRWQNNNAKKRTESDAAAGGRYAVQANLGTSPYSRTALHLLQSSLHYDKVKTNLGTSP